MTLNGFRRIALSMPDATEGFHMGHPDFRVNGKIFASMCSPDERWCMMKLPLPLQRRLMKSKPATFVPASGAWGRQGSTLALVAKVDAATVRPIMEAAWRNVAGKTIKRH